MVSLARRPYKVSASQSALRQLRSSPSLFASNAALTSRVQIA
jgi:hypothetical protein